MRAIVNKIIPFSSVDGPGNRTAVFLQGCNIDCKYCHNPETRVLCIHCGICVPGCPAGALSADQQGKVHFDPTSCIHCDQCIKSCPHDSSPKVAEMTAEEVFLQIEKQIPFIRGITVSGGECMLYPEFIAELFTLAKLRDLSTLLDSNGTILYSDFPELMAVTDGVMLDIKAFYAKDHIQVTGAENACVLENAAYLSSIGKLYEVRCVIVPDLYDARKNIYAMADFLLPLYNKSKFQIKLIAYRKFGVRDRFSYFRTPDAAELELLANILRQKGFEQIIII